MTSGTMRTCPTPRGRLRLLWLPLLMAAGAACASAQLTLSGPLPNATEQAPYQAQINASGGTSPYHFSIVSAGSIFPAGLQLSDSGRITGTPTVYGTFSFTISAVDSSSPAKSGSARFDLTIQPRPTAPFVFVTASLPDAVFGAEYAGRIEVSGGRAPYSFSVPLLDLPLGMQFNISNGLFSGRVSASPGGYPIMVTAKDSSVPQQTIQGRFVIRVLAGLSVGPATLISGVVGSAYSDQLRADGGTPPYSFSVTSGNLPQGLQLSRGTGALSGTPTLMGAYSFRVTATDSKGLTGYADCIMDVRGPSFSVTPGPNLRDGRVGAPYAPITFTTGGGIAPYRYTLFSGVLPDGLSLNAQGILAGTPTRDGSYNFEVKVADQPGNFVVVNLYLTIKRSLNILPVTLSDGTLNTAYAESLQADGFLPDVTLSISAGTLPPGLSLSKNPGSGAYLLGGSPRTAGTYAFTVQARDSANSTFSRSYTIKILQPNQIPLEVRPESLPPGRIGESYAQTIVAWDGRAPWVVRVASGSLPSGLTLAASGSLSGAPASAGTYNFTAEVRDAENRTGSRAYTLYIFSGPLTVLPATLSDASVGQDYSVTFSASGGTPPYTFVPLLGAPQGILWYGAEGALRGKPMVGGTYTLRIQATDSLGNTGTRDYTLKIIGAIIAIQPESLPAAQWAVPYSVRLSASGGVAPYSFRSSCNFPAGLTLSLDGLLSGTPTRSGSNPCVIWAQDSSGGYGERRYTLEYRAPAFTLSPLALDDGKVNVFYWRDIAAVGANAPVRFTITNGSLPPGLTADLRTSGYLNIVGAPTAAGTYSFRVTATDATGVSVSADYTIKVTGQPIMLGPDTLPAGVVSLPYSANLSASGGTPPYTFSADPWELPGGLTLSASGGLRGTLAASGNFGFTVEATDSRGLKGTKYFGLVVSAATLTLTPLELPVGVLRRSYTASLSASGGNPPYNYSLAQGTLPRGLALSAGGLLAGTPESAGTFDIRIVVRDAAGAVGSRGYQLRVTGDTITLGPGALPDAYLGQPYSARLTASGGTSPYTFAITYGQSWSADLSLNADGTITGTPSGSGTGTLSFTVIATDANGSYGYRDFQIKLRSAGSLTLLPATLPPAVVGQFYDTSMTAAGGTWPYTFTLASGALPTGLELYAQGRVFGTPATAGRFSFRVDLADSKGLTTSRDYEIVVSGAAIILDPESLQSGKLGTVYSASITAAGGTAPYAFSLVSGSLPAGLALASTGKLTGTPQTSGTFNFRIQATDSKNSTGTRDYLIVVNPAGLGITPDALPRTIVGRNYSVVFGATGGAPPYQFSLSSGSLPPGLTLSQSGTLSGKLQRAGTFPFQVQAGDSLGVTGTCDYTLVVDAAGILVTPSTLEPASAGRVYSVTLVGSGGRAPYQFALNPNSVLPLGMTLSSAGVLSGTPSNPGIYNFSFFVLDADSVTATVDMVLEVRQAGLRITPDLLPIATIGTPYSATIVAEGGAAPYGFSLASGSLPLGLTLAASGALNGNLREAGVFSFQVRATDKNGITGLRDYQLRISPIEITPNVLRAATVGQAWGVSFGAAGGTAPYRYGLSVGALPPGITVIAQGGLTGTPTTAGTFHFTIEASDVNGAKGSCDYALSVYGAELALLTESLPDGGIGRSYFADISAAGGRAPYVFSVKSGALPAGLRLKSEGGLSGTPRASGLFRFAVQAQDALGVIAAREYALRVSGESSFTVLTTWLSHARVNTAYSASLEASGGTPPYTWRVSGGVLPRGIELSAGVIRGAPIESGQFLFTATVTDNKGQEASQVLLLMVTTAPETGNTLFFDPQELSFSVRSNSTGESAPRCIAVFSTKAPALISASLFTPSAAWATLGADPLRTPSSLCLKAHPAGLAPGVYRGELRMTSPDALPASVSVPLVLNVSADSPPLLRVTPNEIDLTVARGAAPLVRSVVVSNSSSETLRFTLKPPVSGWLSPLATSGSSLEGGSQAIALRVDPSGLEPGFYSDTILVQAGESSEAVRVALTISDAPGLLSLSQTAVELVAWAGSPETTSNLGVTNEGLIPLTAEASTETTDGADWLQARLPAAELPPGGTAPLTLAVRTQSLSPGRYTGRLRVRAAGAANAPQMTTVGLTVLPSDAPLPAETSLNVLVLTPQTSRASIALSSPPGSLLTFTTATSGSDTGWLAIAPAAGAVPAGGSLSITVTADASGRAPGIYRATVSIGLSDGATHSVPVEFFVPSQASGSKQAGVRLASASCDQATPLVVHVLSPSPGFRLSSGRPVTVRAQIERCDGSPASGVEITASAGEKDIAISPESLGTWSGTWVPEQAGDRTRLEVVVTAGEVGVSSPAIAVVEGKVTAAMKGEPAVVAAVHSATTRLEDPLVPGGLITISGSNLADKTSIADTAELPKSLAGAEVLLGDLPLPVYYASPGQIYAVIPRALAPNTRHQLLVRRRGVPAVPVTVAVSAVQPGLFTMNNQGAGQASALIDGTASVAASGSPVARGGMVDLYCTGLGLVDYAPMDGAPASLTQPARVRIPVSVTVGGHSAEVSFAGLSPGTVGLYHIRVKIPEDAPTGDAVEVVVRQKNATSNPVTIAIR